MPDLVYYKTNQYELIWNDIGSGAHDDISIWKVENHNSEFCSLGDVISFAGPGQHHHWIKPNNQALLVKANIEGVLTKPSSFKKIWSDKGSGAKMDLSIYEMVAPDGFR